MMNKALSNEPADLHLLVEQGAGIEAQERSSVLNIYGHAILQRVENQVQVCKGVRIVAGQPVSGFYGRVAKWKHEEYWAMRYQAPEDQLGHIIIRTTISRAIECSFAKRDSGLLFRPQEWHIVLSVPVSAQAGVVVREEDVDSALCWLRQTDWETRDADEKIAVGAHQEWLSETEAQYAVVGYRDTKPLVQELKCSLGRHRRDEDELDSLVTLFMLRFVYQLNGKS